VVLVLARIIGGNRGVTLSARRFIAALGTVALPAALILQQPDLGTVVLLVLTALGMFLVAGLSRQQKVFLFLSGMVIAVISWKFLLVGYQRERFLVFLTPERDPLGSGYTVLQARTAFGSGGLFGRGLGWGSQSRLNVLPEARTDFAFARLGEELGFLGVTLTLGLFGVLFSRLLRASQRTSDGFGRALVVGSFLSLLVGLAVNAGMNIGLLPVTGVPLPFISYGGSSLVASFLFLGMSLSVVVHGERWEPVPIESALIEAHA
jgi:rod shape determining protein RodA